VTHKKVACFPLIESEDYKEYKPPSLENGYLRLGGDSRLNPENVARCRLNHHHTMSNHDHSTRDINDHPQVRDAEEWW
jgi:hypothetical protein